MKIYSEISWCTSGVWVWGEGKDSSGTEGYSLNVLYIAYRLLALCVLAFWCEIIQPRRSLFHALFFSLNINYICHTFYVLYVPSINAWLISLSLSRSKDYVNWNKNHMMIYLTVTSRRKKSEKMRKSSSKWMAKNVLRLTYDCNSFWGGGWKPIKKPFH